MHTVTSQKVDIGAAVEVFKYLILFAEDFKWLFACKYAAVFVRKLIECADPHN
jgi:hypothetical protein